MTEIASTYGGVLTAWVVLAGLALLQAIVEDLAGIRGKRTPGMPVTTGHDDFLFRAIRAHSNTQENLPVFMLLSLAAVLLGASPGTTTSLVWTFVGARVLHMVAYYTDLRTLRSAAFAVGFLAMIGLFVVTFSRLA